MGRPRASGSAPKGGLSLLALVTGICLAASAISMPAAAASHHHRWRGQVAYVWHRPVAHTWRRSVARALLSLTEPEKDAALILDGETGKTLYARNADELRHPASLTKIMTLYLLFEQLKSGQMTLATPLYVSEHAAVQPRTKLYLHAGSTIPVDTAIKAIVVLSANDVAVTIAEAIGGTEQHFAQMMTAKAHTLGMKDTNYDNASGLPDPLQITTASDLAILARHVAYDFPQYFHYFSIYSFNYRGATFFTHDNLIGRYDGADGIKTGYTNASGFNLVSSVVRNGVHIIGVVMGGITARRRDAEMIRLLDDTFAAIGRNPQLVAREEIPWQAIAQDTGSAPVIAGFQFGSADGAVLPSIPPMTGQTKAPSGETGEGDEDSAESRPDPQLDSIISNSKPSTPPTSQLRPPQAVPAKNQTAVVLPSVPAQIPRPRDPLPQSAVVPSSVFTGSTSVPVPQPKPHLTVADYEPATSPGVFPKPRAGDPQEGTAPIDNYWTVQIGAFASATLARAKLDEYAAQSGDVLAQSSRIVTPFQTPDGHTLYRARFGPFAESDARHVCEDLTERGETCFAAFAAH